MSVYKELRELQELQYEQVQIYNDAADYGIPVYTMKDSAVRIIKGLIEMYDFPVKTTKYATGTTQEVSYDGGVGMYLEAGFSQLKITFVTTREHKRFQGYISIDLATPEGTKIEAIKYEI